MIDCRPQGICSWNYFLTGEDWNASLRIGSMREQGAIDVNGEHYDIRKHGFASGAWSLETCGKDVFSAHKRNPFTRTIDIAGPQGNTTLQGHSTFSRTMMLSGPDTDCQILPRHAFTRRATMTGRCGDIPLACFAFWLTVLLWRRAANNSNGAS